MLVCALLSGCGGERIVNDHSAKRGRVVEAKYPETVPYPDGELQFTDYEKFESEYSKWSQSRIALEEDAGEYDPDPVSSFTLETAKKVLTSGEAGKNAVYSPTNVYIALAMLAEMTEGDSRSEILSLLGFESVEQLRQNTRSLWLHSFSDDGAVVERLAASLWMNDSVAYNEDVLKLLAENYFASSFSGECGAPEYDDMLHDWLNEQTGGLLKDAVGNIKLSPETVLDLITTIYFRAKWDAKFDAGLNTEEIFHSASGDVTRTFMHRTASYGPYYAAENFGAISMEMTDAGYMWIFLPDEGIAPEDILDDEELGQLLYDRNYYRMGKGKRIKVNISLPKFDVSSTLNLNDTLAGLGVTSCFSPDKADFSPLTGADAYVSSVGHSARVAVDEEGVVATAFTEVMLAGAALPPEEEIDFTVDRPFVFAIADRNGSVIFMGVVNEV